MLLKMLRLVALPLILLHAGSAFALIDVEALAGKRWYKLGVSPSQQVSATEVALAAHVDPIPLIPVSFGVRASSAALNTNDLKSYYGAASVSSALMVEAGLDVMVWVPLIPIITPYARLNLPVYGIWKVAGAAANGNPTPSDFTHNGKVSGVQGSIGFKYSPLPLISVLFEVNRAAETWKESEAKVGGQGVSVDSKSHALNSNAVFLGLEVGL